MVLAPLREQLNKMHYCQRWKGYDNYDHHFTYPQVDNFFDEVLSLLEEEQRIEYPVLVDKNSKVEVFNIPCSFDIETSSFYSGTGEKRAIMYIWQFGLNGSVIYGRTWDEFFLFIERLVEELQLCKTRWLYIYVHNLSYEFQFIRKYFEWDKVFALKKRKVLFARFDTAGLKFCCSYLLANASLAHVGDKLLTKYPVKKLVGELDYNLIRHSGTPLKPGELDYCLNDPRVVMSYIQEKIEQDGGIVNIPNTNTGYVRNFTRGYCMANKLASQKFHHLMRSLVIKSEEEYDQNKRAFMGGFTHASILHANKILENVGSADLSSSYPSVIVSRYFPMSSAIFVGQPYDEDSFRHYLENYCCIFDIKFKNLMPKVEFENYLSLSRCIAKDYTVNNGRLVSASECLTTLTELDFDIISKMYDWDEMEVTNLRIYHRGYLPKAIILAVLDLYADKTALKDIPEEVVNYMRSKNMINATFGMMVTDIIRPEYLINEEDEWVEEEGLKERLLNDYNKNFNRFLYYTWGVYVTAHARHNLFKAILEFGEDYVYADTDSIKGLNFDKHEMFFRFYNLENEMAMRKMCNTMDIPFEKVCPKTVKGVAKQLGNWEIEKSYRYFKTCGAKRYIYIYEDGTLSLTVSGLNKKFAVPYLLDQYNNDPLKVMKYFEDGLTVSAGHTGKQTLTYLDNEQEGMVTDYLGNVAYYCEASSIHMEAQAFSMSQTEDYLRLLAGVHENELR